MMVNGDTDDDDDTIDVSQSSQAFTLSPLRAGRGNHDQNVFHLRKIILFFFFCVVYF